MNSRCYEQYHAYMRPLLAIDLLRTVPYVCMAHPELLEHVLYQLDLVLDGS